MQLRFAAKYASAAIVTLLLISCSVVGPMSVEAGRDRYNAVIQDTSKQQLFENILRALDNEPTLFMEVSEVDATLQWGSSLSANIANIGAHAGTSGGTLAGKTKGVGAALNYQESALVRYSPLIGSSLTEQLVSPMTAESLVDLYRAEWPLVSIFSFVVDRIGEGYEGSGMLLNTIAGLDEMGALTLTLPKRGTGQATVQVNISPKGAASAVSQTTDAPDTSDALVLRFLPSGTLLSSRGNDDTSDRPPSNLELQSYLAWESSSYAAALPKTKLKALKFWIRILQTYEDEQGFLCEARILNLLSNEIGDREKRLENSVISQSHNGIEADLSWANQVIKALPRSVTLTTRPRDRWMVTTAKPNLKQAQVTSCSRSSMDLSTQNSVLKSPEIQKIITQNPELMITTRSAIGVLRYATQVPYPLVSVVKGDTYERIVGRSWNSNAVEDGFYIVACEDMNNVIARENPECSNYISRNSGDIDFSLLDSRKNFCANRARAITALQRTDRIYQYTAGAIYCASDERNIIIVERDRTSNRESADYLEGQVQLQLATMRRLMLIVSSDNEPPNSYVKFYNVKTARWYFLDSNDAVSKLNFAFLATIVTIQAASPPQPITPSIPVGGRN